MTARRRIHETVAVGEGAGDCRILLDGRPARTPRGADLAVPGRALAEIVAEEWRAQGARIDPDTMPVTGLANAAIDRIGPGRDAIVDGLAAYGATDLLCYRAPAPTELTRRQAAVWQPLLDWAAERFGAALAVTPGVIAIDQPAAATESLRRRIESLDDFTLATLQLATSATGSLVLGLALLEGRLDGAGAETAAFLVERHQRERWGADPEASLGVEALGRDIGVAARVFALLRA